MDPRMEPFNTQQSFHLEDLDNQYTPPGRGICCLRQKSNVDLLTHSLGVLISLDCDNSLLEKKFK